MNRNQNQCLRVRVRRAFSFGLLSLSLFLMPGNAIGQESQTTSLKKYKGPVKELKLPGRIADIARGGHGRYLFLHIADQRQVAVYDCNEVKIVKYIPLAGDDIKIVAGASKLIVFNSTKKLVSRWELGSWERETIQPFPFSGVFKTAALGYSCDGPMLVHWAVGTSALDRANYDFVDLESLKVLTDVQPFRLNNTSYRDKVHIRASANGSAYGLWATSHSPSGLETLVLNGNTAKQYREHTSAGVLVPGPLGQKLFTGSGLFTIELSPIGPTARRARQSQLPTTLPDLSIRVTGGGVELIDLNTSQTLGSVLTQQTETEAGGWDRHDFQFDKRYTCVVQADQLIYIPKSNDRLVVHSLGLDKMLENLDSPFIFVSSIAPTQVKVGSRFSYQIQLSGASGKVSYELNSGPQGMTLSETGMLTWQVPDKINTDLVFVIATIRTDQLEIFHTLKLKVTQPKK